MGQAYIKLLGEASFYETRKKHDNLKSNAHKYRMSKLPTQQNHY